MSARPKRAALLVPAAVFVLAAGLRLWDLPSPSQLYRDEQHYVFDAEAYIGGGIGIPVGHPPPVRIADVVLLYFLALFALGVGLVGGTRRPAARARRSAHRPEPDRNARFLSHDLIEAGFLLLALDSKRMGSPVRSTGWMGPIERFLGSWFRLGAGLALGAAVASNWAGTFALVFAAALSIAWLAKEPHRGGRPLSL